MIKRLNNRETTHKLKILPKHFRDVVSGNKKFEVLYNDRDYHVNDILILQELFSGNFITVRVTHILDDEKYLQKGYVILSIARVLNLTCDKATAAKENERDQ